ncbi:protein with 2 EFh [Cryptosporidium ryanae]|uniref:protein with 2 EFh n=1 Tax=Cryptosporidium ryanae TaxID=515981 RepID=UPI00351A9523|nr:protein with 2 EFh [Cryptosporidium ryanae]
MRNNMFFTEEEETCYKTWYSIIHNYEESFIEEELFSENNDIPKIGIKTALFLKTSGLPNQVLHEIWRIVDSKNEGLLSFYEFGRACRLISFCQNQGIFPTQELVTEVPKRLACFNIELFLRQFNKNIQFSLRSILDSYFSDELFISKTVKAFRQLDVENKDLVDGSDIFNLFINSDIPRDKLREIWNCSDIDNDGKLSTMEFVVFNALIEVSKKHNIKMNDGVPLESIILLLNNVLRYNYCSRTKDDIAETPSEQKSNEDHKNVKLTHESNLDIDSLECELSDLAKIQDVVSSLKKVDSELIQSLNRKKLRLAMDHKNLLIKISKIYNKYISNQALIDNLWEDIKFLKEANILISSFGEVMKKLEKTVYLAINQIAFPR